MEERRKRDAEHAALTAKADAEEAAERLNSVSDQDMASAFASRYGKFVPPSRATPASDAALPLAASTAQQAGSDAFRMGSMPPVAANPVQLRDPPVQQQRQRSHERGTEPAPKRKKSNGL